MLLIGNGCFGELGPGIGPKHVVVKLTIINQ